MTSQHKPIGNDGPIPAMWSAFSQQINAQAAITGGLVTQQTKYTLDQYQNCTAITGLLNATVTEGGGWSASGSSIGAQAIAGTQSPTGLSGTGYAVCNYAPAATMSVTATSTSITVSSNSGMAVNDGIAGYGIPGNTTITHISGTTITISNAATESATGVPCVVFLWAIVT